MECFEVLHKKFLKDAGTWDLPSPKKVLLEVFTYCQHPFNTFTKQNGIIFAPSTQITNPKVETYTEQSIIMISAFLSYKVCTWKNTALGKRILSLTSKTCAAFDSVRAKYSI